MSEVSTFRLYLLRAMYVFTVVGLAIEKLPALLHPANLSPGDSVILSVLGATALLAVVEIRYPLKLRYRGADSLHGVGASRNKVVA